jgi:hypothetical protein
MVNFLAKKWHKILMNYNYTLYQDCLDPVIKERLFQKASFYQQKLN